MANIEFTQIELSLIQQELNDPTIEIFLKKDWGSENQNYRQYLHTDLKLRGSVADSSISHTDGLGGYVLTQNWRTKVGFDIEVIERVRPELARRICNTEEEFRIAPKPASLWAAKEASFKALKGPHQPVVVTEITIGSWMAPHSQYETCRIDNLQKFNLSVAKGVVFLKSGFVFCFFSARA